MDDISDTLARGWLFDAIKKINHAGWLITELYQRDYDQWFAALRQRGDFTSAHGEGGNITEALQSAWQTASGRKRMTNADWQDARNPKKPSVPRMSLGKPKVERRKLKTS